VCAVAIIVLWRYRPDVVREIDQKLPERVRRVAERVLPPASRPVRADPTRPDADAPGGATGTGAVERRVDAREREADTRAFLKEMLRVLATELRPRVTEVADLRYDRGTMTLTVVLRITGSPPPQTEEGEAPVSFRARHARDVIACVRAVYDNYPQGIRLVTLRSTVAGEDASAPAKTVFRCMCAVVIYAKTDFDQATWEQVMTAWRANYQEGFPGD